MPFEWKGVFPAVTTKFTADDRLDMLLFEKNISFQLQCGADGIVLGGTLGEASTLTWAEKEILVKQALSVCNGKKPVIMNIAEGATAEAVKLAEAGRQWGVDGFMLLPPMRYKPDHREAVTYFKTVANAAELPIMLYNNPVDYKTEITLEMFDELQACTNINAVKESTRDVTNVARMRNRFGERFKILCGVDTLALEELLLGADGWVAGLVCACPAETVAIYRLAKAGRIKEAIQIYRWFMPLLELDIHPKLVQYIKLAETVFGVGSEQVRAPRLTLAGKEREDILQIINHALSTRPVLPDYLSINV